MKRLVEEVQGEGLEKLLGEKVTFYCVNYIYAGKLSGVNDDCVLLTDAEIVYDTGTHSSKTWESAEKMPGDWYVHRQAIESFGVFK